MGRPLAKKYFGDGEGNQLKIRAFVTGGTEGDGIIVKQTGSARYIVDVDGDIGTVYLVDKANGNLVAGDATITFINADDEEKRVKKLLAHRAVFFDDTSAPWSFDPAEGDYFQASDETDGYAALITINTQPTDEEVEEGNSVAFTVGATIDPNTASLEYAWFESQDDGDTFEALSDTGVYSGTDTSELEISDVTGMDGYQYYVVVSATGASDVTSATVTLTVTEAV